MERHASIRRAVSTDLDQLAAVLGSAFADEPWTRWGVDADDHVGRITELQRISIRLLGLPHGLIWLAELDDSVTGAAVWSDSRVVIDRSTFTALADQSRPWHGDRLSAAIEAERNGVGRPGDDHLYLETIGVRRDLRRQGIGARVIGPGLELADRDQLLCALETSTTGNVEFYRSVGFEVVHHRTVAGGGPDVWAMLRSPS